MKKILSILGTITIAGSGMAGLVGNAPAPSKTESNSLKTNNLETLNRAKRDFDKYKAANVAGSTGIAFALGTVAGGPVVGGIASGATAIGLSVYYLIKK